MPGNGIAGLNAFVHTSSGTSAQEFMKDRTKPETHACRVESISPLQGILRCGHCGCGMIPTSTSRKGRRYFYYVCAKHKKSTVSTCPVRQVRGGDIEDIVFKELSAALQAPDIIAAIAKVAKVDSRQVFDIFSENFWHNMSNPEKTRLIQLLIENVVINENDIAIELKTAGVKSMIQEVRCAEEND